ncbi:hypothetical protein ERJ75_001535800 [Trypanosoma vivax]|nr:hypothetical protein ERJ75_001535800 [Trypanosoma vivax]
MPERLSSDHHLYRERAIVGCRYALCSMVTAFVLIGTHLPHHMAEGVFIASSSIDYCERNNKVDPVPCEKKMVVTLSVDAGQDAGVEEVVLVREASDKTRDDDKRVVEFEPIYLTTKKTRVRYHYPLFYERNFNAKPYEEQIPTSLLTPVLTSPGLRKQHVELHTITIKNRFRSVRDFVVIVELVSWQVYALQIVVGSGRATYFRQQDQRHVFVLVSCGIAVTTLVRALLGIACM